MLHGCTVEDRCIIGIGAIVLNGARIGHDSIIAAGTLVPERAVVEARLALDWLSGKLRRTLTDKDRETHPLERAQLPHASRTVLKELARVGAVADFSPERRCPTFARRR